MKEGLAPAGIAGAGGPPPLLLLLPLGVEAAVVWLAEEGGEGGATTSLPPPAMRHVAVPETRNEGSWDGDVAGVHWLHLDTRCPYSSVSCQAGPGGCSELLLTNWDWRRQLLHLLARPVYMLPCTPIHRADAGPRGWGTRLAPPAALPVSTSSVLSPTISRRPGGKFHACAGVVDTLKA